MASRSLVHRNTRGHSTATHGTICGHHVLQFHLRHLSEEQYAIAIGVAGVDRVTLLEGSDDGEMEVQVSDGFDPQAVRAELVGQLRTAALGL